jgi:drug/metabolite transporter (DMT)-like permease
MKALFCNERYKILGCLARSVLAAQADDRQNDRDDARSEMPALRATAVVSVLSFVVATPAYLVWAGSAHLQALPFGLLAFQGLVQGGLQGAVTMVAYSQAVMLLGVSRAVLFPAIVPAVSVLLGIPIVGEIPSVLQVGGLALVTLGLLTTVGMFRWFSGR